MKLKIERIAWPLERVFRISRDEKTEVETVTCTLMHDGFSGRGEGIGVRYHGESIDSICEQLESARTEIESCTVRDELYDVLPAGGARNAVDCAFWDLEAKRSGKPYWVIAGTSEPVPVTTAFTLSLDTPEVMGEARARMRPLFAAETQTGRQGRSGSCSRSSGERAEQRHHRRCERGVDTAPARTLRRCAGRSRCQPDRAAASGRE